MHFRKRLKLDFMGHPIKLFSYTGGASSIPPRPAPHPPTSTYHPPSYAAPPPPTSPTPPATQPEGGGSESPVPVKPVRRKTKKGAAPPPPLTAHPTATNIPNTENNVCILGVIPDNQQ